MTPQHDEQYISIVQEACLRLPMDWPALLLADLWQEAMLLFPTEPLGEAAVGFGAAAVPKLEAAAMPALGAAAVAGCWGCSLLCRSAT